MTAYFGSYMPMGKDKAKVGFADEAGPKLGHRGLIGTAFPSPQEIIIGNSLIGDVGCVTPNVTHIQTLFCKDRDLSGLSFWAPEF